MVHTKLLKIIHYLLEHLIRNPPAKSIGPRSIKSQHLPHRITNGPFLYQAIVRAIAFAMEIVLDGRCPNQFVRREGCTITDMDSIEASLDKIKVVIDEDTSRLEL